MFSQSRSIRPNLGHQAVRAMHTVHCTAVPLNAAAARHASPGCNPQRERERESEKSLRGSADPAVTAVTESGSPLTLTLVTSTLAIGSGAVSQVTSMPEEGPEYSSAAGLAAMGSAALLSCL